MNTWIKKLNRFLSGCWFNHGNILRSRNANGQLMAHCERCDEEWLWWPEVHDEEER
jgi:hypothetical protein